MIARGVSNTEVSELAVDSGREFGMAPILPHDNSVSSTDAEESLPINVDCVGMDSINEDAAVNVPSLGRCAGLKFIDDDIDEAVSWDDQPFELTNETVDAPGAVM